MKPKRPDSKPPTRAVCICELSKDMPWCDGSHAAGTRPRLVDRAVADSGLTMCTCGDSSELPFCDNVAPKCESTN